MSSSVRKPNPHNQNERFLGTCSQEGTLYLMHAEFGISPDRRGYALTLTRQVRRGSLETLRNPPPPRGRGLGGGGSESFTAFAHEL